MQKPTPVGICACACGLQRQDQRSLRHLVAFLDHIGDLADGHACDAYLGAALDAAALRHHRVHDRAPGRRDIEDADDDHQHGHDGDNPDGPGDLGPAGDLVADSEVG